MAPIPEILVTHDPILLLAQGLIQLGAPKGYVETFIRAMQIILPFMPSFLHA